MGDRWDECEHEWKEVDAHGSAFRDWVCVKCGCPGTGGKFDDDDKDTVPDIYWPAT